MSHIAYFGAILCSELWKEVTFSLLGGGRDGGQMPRIRCDTDEKHALHTKAQERLQNEQENGQEHAPASSIHWMLGLKQKGPC